MSFKLEPAAIRVRVNCVIALDISTLFDTTMLIACRLNDFNDFNNAER